MATHAENRPSASNTGGHSTRKEGTVEHGSGSHGSGSHGSGSHGSGSHGHGHGDHDFAHPAPAWILLSTFFALIFLTILTVGIAASPLQLGSFEIWVSMGIASAKALLVCLFFMHMFWDKGFNVLVFLSSLLFVSLFCGFVLMDSYENQVNIEQWSEVLAKPAQ